MWETVFSVRLGRPQARRVHQHSRRPASRAGSEGSAFGSGAWLTVDTPRPVQLVPSCVPLADSEGCTGVCALTGADRCEDGHDPGRPIAHGSRQASSHHRRPV